MFNTNKEISDLVNEITNGRTGKRHRYYSETVYHAKEMGVHVEGDLPKYL